MQRIYKNCGEAVPLDVVETTELTLEDIKLNCKDIKLSERSTDIERELVEACAARRKMWCQSEAADCQVAAIKKQLADEETAFEKLACETSHMEANIGTQVAPVKKTP